VAVGGGPPVTLACRARRGRPSAYPASPESRCEHERLYGRSERTGSCRHFSSAAKAAKNIPLAEGKSSDNPERMRLTAQLAMTLTPPQYVW
jgi:hypothetical protein